MTNLRVKYHAETAQELKYFELIQVLTQERKAFEDQIKKLTDELELLKTRVGAEARVQLLVNEELTAARIQNHKIESEFKKLSKLFEQYKKPKIVRIVNSARYERLERYINAMNVADPEAAAKLLIKFREIIGTFPYTLTPGQINLMHQDIPKEDDTATV